MDDIWKRSRSLRLSKSPHIPHPPPILLQLNCYAFTPSPTSTMNSTVFSGYASAKAGSEFRKKDIIDETRIIDEREGKGTVGQTQRLSTWSRFASSPMERSTPSRAYLLQFSSLKIWFVLYFLKLMWF